MSKRVKHPARNAVVALAAVGMGTSMVFGGGAAFAAEGKAAPVMDPASAVAAQAHAQAKAADKAAAVKKAAAKKSAAKKASSWVKPVSGYTLTASFNQGGSMWSHKHSGQDFAVPVGTPVKAAHSGVVVKAGPNGGGDGPAYGNAIVIKHANGTYSQYAHLSKINVGIGKTVKTGQLIAASGNTGNSSGPHLHFEIRTTPNYGSAVNPAAFLRAEGITI
ncbi:M23 family metallopeptidase [Streptomyces sp. SP18CS02]|uniref:M23 family metallopeptidase n=1 Tax=Streptomyces sp. SP18CS02 TaxID=3002531 RepID=UPI002E7A5C2F|nr:M23 family metallopeptidase [Streptomyces sp. SP18CS02]MEE1756698.1 M23 family metallopeptidase [Streptomyces sp. SP18CS02]